MNEPMNEVLLQKEKADPDRLLWAWTDVQAAQRLATKDRTQGWAALNLLFRKGAVPDPALDGRYAGKLLAIDIAPGLTQFFQSLLTSWMPWLGKSFNAAENSGENIFTENSYPLARIFNPFYSGFTPEGSDTYRGFAFRTYAAPGVFDADRLVLKIDYDLESNPRLTVRRVLDELVQLDDNVYLGKAHVRWWWRRAKEWQTVAYFSLSRQ